MRSLILIMLTMSASLFAKLSPDELVDMAIKAERGDAQAQSKLGEYYYVDNKNYEKGLYWMNRAAAQGNSWAMFLLYDAYRFGVGVPKDEVLAYKWILLIQSPGNLAKTCRDNFEKIITPAQREMGAKLAAEFKIKPEVGALPGK
jgi:TPR repeat protein